MTKTIYRGKIVRLEIDRVKLPGGRSFDMEMVRHPGGAAVVALDRHHNVCMLRQYRHVAGGWLWELPAGKRDGDEPPETTARRELREEAGRSAEHWTPLGRIWSSPGVFDEEVHLFLARGLREVPSDHSPHEVLEVHWLPLAEAVAEAATGGIRDAKTVAGLFRAQHLLDSLAK